MPFFQQLSRNLAFLHHFSMAKLQGMTGHQPLQILWCFLPNHGTAQQVPGLNRLSPVNRVSGWCWAFLRMAKGWIQIGRFQPLEFQKICAGPIKAWMWHRNNDTKYTKEPNTVNKFNMASFLRGHHIKTAWISVCHEGPCGSGPICRGCLATKREWDAYLNSADGAEWISKGTTRQKVNYVVTCI